MRVPHPWVIFGPILLVLGLIFTSLVVASCSPCPTQEEYTQIEDDLQESVDDGERALAVWDNLTDAEKRMIVEAFVREQKAMLDSIKAANPYRNADDPEPDMPDPEAPEVTEPTDNGGIPDPEEPENTPRE